MSEKEKFYPQLDAKNDVVATEKRIIEYWQQKMQTYTDSEDFERARTCKRQLQALKRNKKLWDK